MVAGKQTVGTAADDSCSASREGENGTKVKLDIVGSLNPGLTRARGWFRFRAVLGEGEGDELPAGTRGTSGEVGWRARRR